ncbi:cofilin [Mortierella alpina]|nr:cofilin [Mortierella alpina]
MSSGPIVTGRCLTSYNNLLHGVFPYITYEISDDHTEIHVGREGYVSSYEDVLSELLTDECRFAIYKFTRRDFGKFDSRSRVILFIDWCPVDADIKAKNIYAASKDALINALQGIDIVIHATNLGDLSRDIVLDKIKCH